MYIKIGARLGTIRGKYLCRSLFLMSQWPVTFLIRDSDIDVSCELCENAKNTIFTKLLLLFYGTYL